MLALPWNPKGLVISALEVWEEAGGFVKKTAAGTRTSICSYSPIVLPLVTYTAAVLLWTQSLSEAQIQQREVQPG